MVYIQSVRRCSFVNPDKMCLSHSAIGHVLCHVRIFSKSFLIAEGHNWFSKCSIRQQTYCNLYKAINVNSTPLKIPARNQARWLSIQIADCESVDRVEIAFSSNKAK